jgi:hypothetical protein
MSTFKFIECDGWSFISLKDSSYYLQGLFDEAPDEMVTYYLEKKEFVDFNSNYPRDTPNEHAKLIASLVNVLQTDGKFKNVIEISVKKDHIVLFDCCHRMRAYRYLKIQKIPCHFHNIGKS